MSATTEQSDWPLGDLEEEVIGLKATIGILGHLIQSPFQVERAEWCKVEDELNAYASRIEALWKQASDRDNERDEAHEAALVAVRAEAKAEKAAPGSKEEAARVDATWQLLAAAVMVAAKNCGEAGYKLEPFGPRTGASQPEPEPQPPAERMRW